MADQSIPQSPPVDESRRLPPVWQLFFAEQLRRIAELERRVKELEETP